MTEYTTSSEAIREYLTARERTALWVQRHFQHGVEDVLSPSIPPSQLDDSDAPSYGPSESEESSHSLPPRMVLRWNDGRPDIPIAPDVQHSRSRSHSRSHSRRGPGIPNQPPVLQMPPMPMSRPQETMVPNSYPRYEQSLSYASVPGQEIPGGHTPPPASPEHIVVLPSPQEEDPQAPVNIPAVPSHTSRHEPSLHSRAPTTRSMPVHHDVPPGEQSPDSQTIVSPTPRHGYNTSHVSRHTTRSPPITHSQSQPLPLQHENMRLYGDPAAHRAPSQLPYTYAPPAIVYAPSKHSSSRYAPPAIVYSPPSHPHAQLRGPAPSIAYSQSAPLPHGHNPYYSHASSGSHRPSQRGVPSQLSSSTVEEESEEYFDAQDRSNNRRRSDSRSHRRHASTSERSRGRSAGVITVPRSPSRSQSRSGTPSLDDDDAGSQSSGGTYYILPTPGQKVQIIVSPLSLLSTNNHFTLNTATRRTIPIHRHIYYQKRPLPALSIQSQETLFPAHFQHSEVYIFCRFKGIVSQP